MSVERDLQQLIDLTTDDCYQERGVELGTLPQIVNLQSNKAYIDRDSEVWLDDFDEELDYEAVKNGTCGAATLEERKHFIKAELKRNF